LSYSSNSNNLFTITDQWQRFDVNSAIAAGASNFYAVDFRNQTNLSEIILWGANATNDQDYATSYIPSNGSTVTRNQDVCTNGGSLASINSTEGVLYAEIAKNSLSNNNQISISLSSGSTNNRVMLFTGANDQRVNCQVRSGGSTWYSSSFDLSVGSTNFNKIAIKYKENDFSFWVNGSKINQATTGVTPLGLNELAFDVGSSANNFFGKTKALAVWKEALSDQELADLTYPTPTDPTFTLDFDTIATDFTFARGSEATYVDAQGLIKSTNEIGPELVTNGDFATDSDWNLGDPGWSISGGTANGNSPGSTRPISQIVNGLTAGKTYRVSFDLLNITSGYVRVYVYKGASGTFTNILATPESQNGTYEVEFEFGGTDKTFRIYPSSSADPDFIGSIDNVSVKEVITATNTPRLDYSTGAEAFLLEPQSTNLVPYSEDFTVWNQIQNVNLILNSTISPSGENNATKFLSTTGNSKVRNNFSVVSGTTYTFSVYCKNIDATFVRLLAYDGANEFSLNVVSQINTSTWTKVSLTFTATNTSGSGQVQIARDLPDGESLYFWGAQLEEQPYATSYIPTSGTTVTRNQETCINATPEINSEEGVLYAEIAALANDGTFRMISISDGTNNNRIRVNYSATNNHIQSRVVVGGVTQAEINKYGFLNITDFTKIAISYKENEVKLYINGQLIGTDTSATMPSANIFNVLNFNGAISNNFFGNTKDVQVYTKALSDAELIKLTT